MRLHNKLKITKGEKEYISYNNLLLPAVEFLNEFKPYFSFLSVGEDGSETIDGQSRLNAFLKSFPLETESYNFNPLNGTLYITKKLVLGADEKTPLKISEVGITADGENDNPKVANRFLANLGEPIFRDAGEEMAFEVSIYLELGESKSVVFTAGENRLVKFLLGDWDKPGKVPTFLVARGTDKTANSTTIERSTVGLILVPALSSTELDRELGEFSLNIVSDLGEGVVEELLLILDDVVVARTNVSEISGVEEGLSMTMTADWDNMATIDILGLNTITSVVDDTDAVEITDYTTTTYGTSFASDYLEIFSGLGYTKDTVRVISKEGDKVGFVKDNAMEIYDFSGDTPVLMPRNVVIDTTDAYIFVLIENQLLIKWHNATDGTYGVRFYLYRNDKWYKSNYQCVTNETYYPGVNASSPWHDIDATVLNSASGSNVMYMISAAVIPQGSVNGWMFGWKTYINAGNNLAYDSYTYNNFYNQNYVEAMLPTNRLKSGVFITFDQTKSELAVITGTGYYYEYDNSIAVDVASKYRDQGFPKAAKNFAFALDQEEKKLKAYSIDEQASKQVSFATAEKLFVSDILNYIAIKEAGGNIRVFYLDGNLTTYEFNGGLPYAGADVEDVLFLGSKIVVFLADGKIKYIPINLNKYIINGVEKGHKITITYSADNTPGAAGGNVRSTIKLKASI